MPTTKAKKNQKRITKSSLINLRGPTRIREQRTKRNKTVFSIAETTMVGLPISHNGQIKAVNVANGGELKKPPTDPSILSNL
jgi:hypothetical protein